ncbi:bifunctional 2-polyprenyl-6-hydroxyphenol methylase/3-demethylubiquinol 3-O-methyltransferase UbiG [Ferrovibrio sp.]|uniref:class I SAM-dependent methyltransferase n=1 Tax=Ferrovibrio sp. TaxID=1917215 RepID=UPI0025B7CEC4|nr:class I SAM-dependent methyltransferase [Ferrovibrio sp.]
MNQDEYERMAALEQSLWWYRALHAIQRQRLAALGLAPGSRVLDAGCGTGGFLQHLQQFLPGLAYSGLEFNSAAAEHARHKTGMMITIGSVNTMPYADGSFDAIVSNDVLNHAGVQQTEALQEFLRCLKPGGHLLLNLPAFAWMRSAHDHHVHNARRYTAGGASTLLVSSGFRVLRAGYWNSLLFPLMLVHRLTVGQSQQSSDVQMIAPWLNRLFLAIVSQEARLQRLGLGLPFGGSVWLLAQRPAEI